MKEKVIYYLIMAVKFLYPKFRNISTDVIYAQAYHETGGFTSAIFKENNNMFGLKLPKKRNTFAKGENRGHAVYSDWVDCIADYFERQIYFGVDTTDTDAYMKSTQESGYAEDTSYINAWAKVLNKVKGQYLSIGILLLFFLLVVWLVYRAVGRGFVK